MSLRPRHYLFAVLAAATLGFLFASVATYDFVAHLDREIHDVHCSFIPGMSGSQSAESGCQVTMISPYSSMFRQSVWGGIPISLPGMAVFAFLAFFAAELLMCGLERNRRALGFLAIATGIPGLATLIWGYLSLVELDTVCKLCIGIYVSSIACIAAAVTAWYQARKNEAELGTDSSPILLVTAAESLAWGGRDDAATIIDEREDSTQEDLDSQLHGKRLLAAALGIGVLFVGAPVVGYAIAAPDHSNFIGSCGALAQKKDDYQVMVPLASHPGQPSVIEVLDPLCPSCRAFEERLSSSDLGEQMDRKAVLFPLDNSCNWMVTTTLHPGACVISEAMLCAGPRAAEVLAWSFANQAAIIAAATNKPTAAADMVKKQFPELASCVGSAGARSRLNRSLRWAVQNRLPVLTPQLYVEGTRLCDEDSDLGLEFSLSRMLSQAKAGTLKSTSVPAPVPVPEETRPAAPKPTARPAAKPAVAPVPVPVPVPDAVEPPPAEAAPDVIPETETGTEPAAPAPVEVIR